MDIVKPGAYKGPQQQAQSRVPMAGFFNGDPGTVYNTKPLQVPSDQMTKPLQISQGLGPGGKPGGQDIAAPPLPPGSGVTAPTNPQQPGRGNGDAAYWLRNYLGSGVSPPNQPGGNPLYPNGQQSSEGPSPGGQQDSQQNMMQQLMRMLMGGRGAGGQQGGMPFPQFQPGYANQQGYGYSNDSQYQQPWMGGQNANLGRYAPPMFNMDGQSINQGQGGYAYNLPNNYGPYPQFSQFGMGEQFGNRARPWMPPGGG